MPDTKQCRKCSEEKALEDFYYRKDSESHRSECKLCTRNHQLMISYGITYEDYKVLFEKQGGKCGICGTGDFKNYNNERFAVDHCHDTGAVRGLLCNTCNHGMGLLQDDAELLRKAIVWLEEAKFTPK